MQARLNARCSRRQSKLANLGVLLNATIRRNFVKARLSVACKMNGSGLNAVIGRSLVKRPWKA